MSDVKTFVDTVGKDVTTVAVPRIEALATGINDKVLNTYGPRVSAFANELVKDIINEQSASVRDFVSALIQELAERYREPNARLAAQLDAAGIALPSWLADERRSAKPV